MKMPYCDFKTIDQIKDKFKIPSLSQESLFSEMKEVKAGRLIKETLDDNIPLALNINSLLKKPYEHKCCNH
jgi:hypothetical protein